MPKTKKVQKNTEKPIQKKGIFDYEAELTPPKVKTTKTAIKRQNEEEHFIGTNEPKPVNKKKLKKIKKEKKKEKKTKDKELKKIEKEQEKENKKRIKRNRKVKKINTKPTEEQIRRKAKAKFLIKIFTLILVIAGIIVFMMLSPIFNIKNIIVENNNLISEEQIISLSNIQKDVNMFKVSKKDTIKAIKENAYIKSVDIKRVIPDTIKIVVTERTPTFMIEHGSSYVYIDNNGYMLEISETPKEGLPKIKGYETEEENIAPGNRLCQNDLKKLNMVLKIMASAKSNEIDDIITTINIEDESNYSIYFETEGKTAYIGDCTSLDTRMLFVKVILEKEKNHEGEIFVNMDLNEKNPFFREKV